jgi:hypothetical protein
MLSIYDDALIRFFYQIKWGGRIIPVVLAGADRAHAQVKDWLEKNRGIFKSRSQGDTALPYPFIAVWKERWKEYSELVNPREIRMADGELGYGYAMRSPRPVQAGVDVNIYCYDLEQCAHIEMQILQLFPQNHAWIPIDYGDTRWYAPPNEGFSYAKILGQQKIRFVMEGLTDNSKLEDAGLGQREVRLTLSGNLFGWIPFQPYAVPVAKFIEVQLADSQTEETYASVTIACGDEE